MFFMSHSVTQKLSPTYRELYIGGGGVLKYPLPHFFYPFPWLEPSFVIY